MEAEKDGQLVERLEDLPHGARVRVEEYGEVFEGIVDKDEERIDPAQSHYLHVMVPADNHRYDAGGGLRDQWLVDMSRDYAKV